MKNNRVVWGLLLVSLGMTGCTQHDEQYYRLHPQALQDAIAQCPEKAPKMVTCEALHKMAIQVNEWVYELRMSPQGYGQTILALQEEIARQEQRQQNEDKQSLEKNKQILRERLAIVSWLESPAS
jgi:hypothetical protein